MKTRDFIRRRARIEHIYSNKPAVMRKAMEHLVVEAGAEFVRVNGKVEGWRMSNGQIVCKKIRYLTEQDAMTEIEVIARLNPPHHNRVPNRAYPCSFCGGWHLTSQARS